MISETTDIPETPGIPGVLGSNISVYDGLLESVSARDQRTLALRFLRSKESMASLLRRCAAKTSESVDANAIKEAKEAKEAQVTMACVLLMARRDAPQDLVMTDAGLYSVVRNRITEIRMGGWL